MMRMDVVWMSWGMAMLVVGVTACSGDEPGTGHRFDVQIEDTGTVECRESVACPIGRECRDGQCVEPEGCRDDRDCAEPLVCSFPDGRDERGECYHPGPPDAGDIGETNGDMPDARDTRRLDGGDGNAGDAGDARSDSGTECGPSNGCPGDGICFRNRCKCDQQDAEPNNSEDDADEQSREPSYDCSDYRDSVSGTLGGSDDVDWYMWKGTDHRAGGCSHRASVDTSEARVCIFGKCALAESPTTSCASGSPAISPEGVPGCCSESGEATLDIVCKQGSSTATTYYLRIDEADACLDYRTTFRASGN